MQFVYINSRDNMDKARIFIIYNSIMMSKDNHFFRDMLTFAYFCARIYNYH